MLCMWYLSLRSHVYAFAEVWYEVYNLQYWYDRLLVLVLVFRTSIGISIL